MDKIISLKEFRAIKECKSLFKGYSKKLSNMNKAELLSELEKFRKESDSFPEHLLTLVKGEILLTNVERVATTPELNRFVKKELARISHSLKVRLHKT